MLNSTERNSGAEHLRTRKSWLYFHFKGELFLHPLSCETALQILPPGTEFLVRMCAQTLSSNLAAVLSNKTWCARYTSPNIIFSSLSILSLSHLIEVLGVHAAGGPAHLLFTDQLRIWMRSRVSLKWRYSLTCILSISSRHRMELNMLFSLD